MLVSELGSIVPSSLLFIQSSVRPKRPVEIEPLDRFSFEKKVIYEKFVYLGATIAAFMRSE